MPTWECTQNITEYLQKGMPLSLMLCFEWSSQKILILMSGRLGVAEQAAQTIFRTILMLFQGPIIGLQTSMACQIGRQIGR